MLFYAVSFKRHIIATQAGVSSSRVGKDAHALKKLLNHHRRTLFAYGLAVNSPTLG